MPDASYQEAPFPSWHFIFEVDGTQIGTFQECSGLSVDVDVEEVQEGGENGFVHKLPGRMTWPNIVLKRGVVKTDNLFTWLGESSGTGFAGKGNKLTRRTASVSLMTPDDVRFRQWDFVDAFAVKWSGPTFDAATQDYATEELEIAHHGFTAKTF